MEMQSVRDMPRSENLHRIGGHRGWQRNIRYHPAIRPPELQRAVLLAIYVKAFLVDRAMMPPTEHGEIRQRRRSALRPMAEVMPLAERQPAPRESAAVIAVLECSP